MKKNGGLIFSFLLLSAWVLKSGHAQVPAFTGAEGFGMYTPGGRGESVIKVFYLNDSGNGSLRAALMSSGPRIVVFEVKKNLKLITLYFSNETNILSVKHSEDVRRVEIYSITGAKLFSGEYHQKHLSIPLQFNSTGLHLVRVKDDKNEIETHKLFMK